MSARGSKIERWLVIDTTGFLADSAHLTAAELGRAWLNILGAVSLGVDPEFNDEPTRLLWASLRVKQRVGRSALSAAIRAAVFERDGRICRYCGATDEPFEIDHVHPVAKGGSDAMENLAVACEPCNRAKGAKTIVNWMGRAQ